MAEYNTLYLRLEGALQSWGDNSKHFIRRTMNGPTKSGVLGIVCCAMGVGRKEAKPILERLNTLTMGVRIDRPGVLASDYHTVGAGIGVRMANGKGIKRTASTDKIETLITRRQYLCDASFLVCLQGEPANVEDAWRALMRPRWPVFLGRKSCPPSMPLVSVKEYEALADHSNLLEALVAVPVQRRMAGELLADNFTVLTEWRATPEEPNIPGDSEVWQDEPVLFDPPVHRARIVVRKVLPVPIEREPMLERTPVRQRISAGYETPAWRELSKKILHRDNYRCVFCKSPAQTVQHVTYRHARRETPEDLRSLCRLCHDAVTMIEYGLGMGLDRINPEEAQWRDEIIRKRDEIIKFRSLATRKRHLQPEEVE